MLKGKVYSVVGIDGVQLSRTKGLSVLYNGVKANNSSLDDEVYNMIRDVESTEFVEQGIDLVVEYTYNTDGSLTANQIVDSGIDGEFEDYTDAE